MAIIKKEDQAITLFDTKKTIEVLTKMLEERKEIEGKLKEKNKAIILEQRKLRDEFVTKIEDSGLVDNYNNRQRERDIQKIEDAWKDLYKTTKFLGIFGKPLTNEHQAQLDKAIDDIKRKYYVRYNSDIRGFDQYIRGFDQFDKEFHEFVESALGMKWVGMEIAITTITPTEEQIKAWIRALTCIYDADFYPAQFNIKFQFEYGTQKVNIWKYDV